MIEKAKGALGSASWFLLGIAILVLFFILVNWLASGFARIYFDYIQVAFAWVERIAVLLIILLLVSSIFRRFRIMAGISLTRIARLLLIIVFVESLVIAYMAFGLFWVFIGMLFFGVGVFLLALWALYTAGIASFWLFLISGIGYFILQFIGLFIAGSEMERREKEGANHINS